MKQISYVSKVADQGFEQGAGGSKFLIIWLFHLIGVCLFTSSLCLLPYSSFKYFFHLQLSLASLSAGQYFYKPSRSSYVSYTSPVTSYYNRYSPRVVLPSTYGVVATPTIVRNVITEANSPSAKAALSYLSEGAGLDSCGEQTKVNTWTHTKET